MMQELLVIPSVVAGYPLLGWQGILLWAWGMVGGGWLAYQFWRRGADAEFLNQGVTFLMVAGLLVFLQHVATDPTGQPRGIPIRGYGVFLLVAMLAGVGLAIHRAAQRGVPSEVIQNLALWVFAGGIIGARTFFVVQKWDQFRRDTWWATIYEILRFTEGGLVVLGALGGATLAFVWYVRRYRLPPLALADVIAPALLLGMAIGRWGCLMNGCCYGGPCELAWGLRFPARSAVYVDQLRQGLFDGFAFREIGGELLVTQVRPDGDAHAAGLRAGDAIRRVDGFAAKNADELQQLLAAPFVARDLEPTRLPPREVTLGDGRSLAWTPAMLERSLPVHPTQIYSSVNALILLLCVLSLEPFLTRDGMVMATTLTLYPMTRFLLEVIRIDEGSFGGTGLTVSQNASLLLMVLTAALWLYLARRKPGHAWPVLSKASPYSVPSG